MNRPLTQRALEDLIMDTVMRMAKKESFVTQPARTQLALACGAIVQRLVDEYELEAG